MKQEANSELRLIAEVSAKPENIKALRTALKSLVEPSRAEPGCLQYDLHEDLDRPGHFMFFERWKNATALDAHTKMPHYVAHGPKVKDWVLGAVTLTKLSVL